MNLVINEYCTTIYNQRLIISSEQLQNFFDLITIELKRVNNSTNENYYKIINTFKSLSGLLLIDKLIVNHEIFSLIQNYLIDLLNKWSKDQIILIDKDEYLFEEIINLFAKMIKHIKTTNQCSSSIFQIWFLNENFFQTIVSVLNDICINSIQYRNQDKNMKSLMMLIETIYSYQRGQDHIRNNPYVLLLVDSMVNCLCSSVYFDTLKNLDIKSKNQNSFEEFLLQTIPSYVVWNRGKAQLMIINQLCLNNILQSYQEIYDLFLSSINEWEYSLMESIFYMTALLRYVAYYPSTREYLKENLKLIDSVLIILHTDCLLDNILITTDYNSETNLTDSAISFIFNLTHDCQYLTLIQENPYFSKEIFLKLKHAKVDRVKLHAFMILAKILDEDDIQKLDHIDALVSIFFDYLLRAVNDPCHSFQDVPVERLLISLKAFVQHEEIKEEIAEENYFEILIRCATQKDLHVNSVLQISLEIIWSLIFNNKIHQLLVNNYDNFVMYLKNVLIKSDEQGVQAAAKGILWKLENELILMKQLLDNTGKDDSDEKYDIMISYSHANKDLSHEIYQHLIKSNYRVWLDFENMYGSTLQSMAKAVESSDIILVCMSNSYKQSAACRSEAEYAYKRGRQIIPLIMEKSYRPDGWLGIICASKLYVDFSKDNFDQSYQKLIAQIQLRQRQIPTITTENKVEQIETVTRIETNYHDRYFEWWTHQDILDFLQDKNLDVLRTLFENEQQFDGHSLYILYEQCQSNMELTYQLLNTQIHQNSDHILPYFTYLHFVKELQKQANPTDIKRLIRYFLWNLWRKLEQNFF